MTSAWAVRKVRHEVGRSGAGLHQPGSTDALGLMSPLGGNQAAVPAHDGVGRDDRGNSRQQSPPKGLALGRQPTALVIVEPESSLAELVLENTVLLDRVGDDLPLLSVDPACERREEQLEREEVRHHVR